MAIFDPAYVAAIEREQQRLIRDELERLRTVPQPMQATVVRVTESGDIEIVRRALAVIERDRRVSADLRAMLADIEAL